MRLLIYILLSIAVATNVSAAPQRSSKQKTTQQKSTTTKKTSTSTSSKGKSKKQTTQATSSKKGSNTKKGKSGNKAKAATKSKAKTETSSDVKRQQAAAQQEIAKTRQEIAANDREIKAGLQDLVKINDDILTTKTKAKELGDQVNTLGGKIAALNAEIEANRAELQRLRESYLRSIKKMRLTKGNQSDLAFIFSSKNFNQALRRMRYLKEFSQWRDKKSSEINKRVGELDYQTKLLAQTKNEKDVTLAMQIKEQKRLEGQYVQQDALVTQLKQNGEALNAHLAKKQAEARELNNRVAALIAAEQRKAEEARLAEVKRKEEAKAKAEAERAAKAKAEAERAAAQKQKEKEKAQANKEIAAKSPTKSETKSESKNAPASPEPAKTKTKTEAPAANKNSDYAAARKRRSRTQDPAANTATAPAKPKATGFEAQRGALPKPVSGSFRITSPFGRHELPDLPGVEYDNPGIDAEVSAGSAAQAVYAGKVSGVYKLPGYNTVVIVSHGNYYTVYGNIAGASVSVGDEVKQGTRLGPLAKDENGRTSIHFEVWKNRDKLNPASWIR